MALPGKKGEILVISAHVWFIYSRRLIIVALDTIGNYIPFRHAKHLETVLNDTAKFLNDKHQENMEALFVELDCPLQNDSSSCGLFMLQVHLIERFLLCPGIFLSMISSHSNTKTTRRFTKLTFPDTEYKDSVWNTRDILLKREQMRDKLDFSLEVTKLLSRSRE
jgi:hypothetical protein